MYIYEYQHNYNTAIPLLIISCNTTSSKEPDPHPDSAIAHPVDTLHTKWHTVIARPASAQETRSWTIWSKIWKNTRPSWQYVNTNYQGIPIVAFTSGFGDDRYSTYIGFDKDGRPCRLLTDFGLVN